MPTSRQAEIHGKFHEPKDGEAFLYRHGSSFVECAPALAEKAFPAASVLWTKDDEPSHCLSVVEALVLLTLVIRKRFAAVHGSPPWRAPSAFFWLF